MESFGVSNPLSLQEAQDLIKQRCQSWDASNLAQKFIDKKGEDWFYRTLLGWSGMLHRHIFEDILSNAGEVRESDDANEGIVEFGLPVKNLSEKNDCSNGRFSGVTPERIFLCLQEAFSYLKPEEEDPLKQAAIFYQQFIRCHPFYDGNGRIGRFIVEAYLWSYSMFIDWEKMSANTRWIKQLNYCHRKSNLTDKRPYNFALKWWIHHLRKFCFRIPSDFE